MSQYPGDEVERKGPRKSFPRYILLVIPILCAGRISRVINHQQSRLKTRYPVHEAYDVKVTWGMTRRSFRIESLAHDDLGGMVIGQCGLNEGEVIRLGHRGRAFKSSYVRSGHVYGVSVNEFILRVT